MSDPLKERRWRCIKQNIAYLDPCHFIEDMFMGIAKPQFSEPCRLSSARNVLAITRLVSDCPFAHDLRQLVPCRPMATRPRRRANLRRPSSRGTRTPNSIGPGLADQIRGIRDAPELPASGPTTRQPQGGDHHRAPTPTQHGRPALGAR